MSRFAIQTPYFIVVVAMMIAVLGGSALVRMPVDLFPNINIPMVVVATFYNGMPGWHWRGWPGYSTTTVDYERVGTLVVDVFDTGTKKLVWRGVATDTLSSKPEKNDKKLDEATEKMFKDFPPKSRGL